MIHPCCGYSLQKGTKLIAFIDMGLNVCSVLMYLFLIIWVLATGDQSEIPEPMPIIPGNNTTIPIIPPAVVARAHVMEQQALIIMFVFAICCYTALFYLSRFLYDASIQRDYEKIQLWYLIAWILLIIRVVMHLISMTYSFIYFGALGLVMFLYQLYSLWVVGAFKEELAFGYDSFRDDETFHLRRGMNLHYFKI